jgi:hypothetical protein
MLEWFEHSYLNIKNLWLTPVKSFREGDSNTQIWLPKNHDFTDSSTPNFFVYIPPQPQIIKPKNKFFPLRKDPCPRRPTRANWTGPLHPSEGWPHLFIRYIGLKESPHSLPPSEARSGGGWREMGEALELPKGVRKEQPLPSGMLRYPPIALPLWA